MHIVLAAVAGLLLRLPLLPPRSPGWHASLARLTRAPRLHPSLPSVAGSKKHGGPVEVLFQLTPVMGATLLITSLAFEKLWSTLPGSPYFASFGMTLLSFALIFVGAIIAFAMVGAGRQGGVRLALPAACWSGGCWLR